MSTKFSGMGSSMVIELVGPLIDDRGELARAIGQVLIAAGVELRPGAIDQVAGAELDWAVRTVLEGHGREDLLSQTPEFVHRITESWRFVVSSREVKLAPGALEGWSALMAQQASVLLLSSLPDALVGALGERLGLPALEQMLVSNGADGSGLPRPDSLVTAFAIRGVNPEALCAAVSSPAAILAAVGARCAQVVQVGLPTGVAETMPVDRFVGRLDELVSGTT